jgi:hypothetical protein
MYAWSCAIILRGNAPQIARLSEQLQTLEAKYAELQQLVQEAQIQIEKGAASNVISDKIREVIDSPADVAAPEDAPPTLRMDEQAVLVVGGSDGSGTRSIVDLLQSLGVKMIVEDNGTKDHHGEVMGGWPRVVKPVLSAAHTLDYEVESLPTDLRESTHNAIKKLLALCEIAVKKVKGSARKVKYGLKAPVSMALVPFFASVTRPLKYLHVVRDGRDIAFSGNQTPIEKFYQSYYNGGKHDWSSVKDLSSPLKAIRMWSDWNVELHDWEIRHDHRDGFEFHLLHTEDLLDSSMKYQTIKQLAEFVGSAMSEDEICCLTKEPPKFLGSHSKEVKKNSGVHSQYGKWKKKVGSDAHLQQNLHIQGKIGLERFEYEPMLNRSPASNAYHCKLTEGECAALTNARNAKNRLRSNAPVETRPSSSQCTLTADIDYRGGDSDIRSIPNILKPEDCCALCLADYECKFFTLDPVQEACFLKRSIGVVVGVSGLISGSTGRR